LIITGESLKTVATLINWESGDWPVADYVPVYSRRERRFRNLGKILFIAVVMLVLSLMASMYFSILENEYQWEWVDLENEQGDTLNGLLLTPNDTPEGGAPAVVLTHDLGGYKEQHNDLAFELARHGFVVLSVDLRDHGRSRGTTTYGDYYEGEPYDIIAAYNYLAIEADGVDPNRIALVGDGFGGTACLMANNILLERDKTVAAVVAWAPPMDIITLRATNWDEIQPYIDRRMGDADFDFDPDRINRSAKLHMDHANWTAGDVYIIYGGRDEKVPPDQFDDLSNKAELYMMAEKGHDLSDDQRVLEFTIDFLYRQLDHSPRIKYAFNSDTVQTVNMAVHASSVAVMIFAFLMVYEVLVMKKTSRSYVAQFSRDIKPMFIGVATLIDIVAYVGISTGVGALYNFFSGEYLVEVLPAARFYTTVFWAGALMLGFGMLIWYIWSYWMPRDEDRTEETSGNLRGIAVGLFAFVIIVINYLLGQVLLYGPNYPKTPAVLLAAALVFVFFLGHELWMRKMLYMKVNALLSQFFLRHRLPYQLSLYGVMMGLYALLSWVMLYNLGAEHFDVDFGTMYLLFIVVIGTVSTIIYHRSKSVLASTTYSAIIGVWLLNLAHHL
jgi:dienelactone hydrolase